jgi:Smg protein
MKQTVLDVLIYLFEHYMEDDVEFSVDPETLRVELKEAGFEDAQVSKAFDWLEGLAAQRDDGAARILPAGKAIRVFTAQEIRKIDLESRGFLVFLEQVGVLEAHSRELVIDRLMALESEEIDLEQVKWVVLMVLFNQPGQEEAFTWMEDLVMEEFVGSLH